MDTGHRWLEGCARGRQPLCHYSWRAVPAWRRLSQRPRARRRECRRTLPLAAVTKKHKKNNKKKPTKKALLPKKKQKKTQRATGYTNLILGYAATQADG